MADFGQVIEQLEKQKSEIQTQLSRIAQALTALNGTGRKNRARGRVMSASARKRIAAAQKRRWAKWHKDNKT